MILIVRAEEESPSHASSHMYQWTTVILSLVLGICSTLVVGIRMWQRAFVQRNVDVSDWFALAALPPTAMYLIVAGLSEIAWHLDRQGTVGDLLGEAIFRFATTIVAIGTNGLILLSILFLYRRVSCYHPSKIFDRAVVFFIVFVPIRAVGSILAVVFTCTPVDAFWKTTNSEYLATHQQSCNNSTAFYISSAVTGQTLDLMIYLMPIAVFWNMQLPRRQKFALGGLLALGFISVVAASARTYFVVRATHAYDFRTNNVYIIILTCLELSCASIAASAPALKVFFKAYFASATRSSPTEQHSRYYQPTSEPQSLTSSSSSSEPTDPATTPTSYRRKSWWQGAAGMRRLELDPTVIDDDHDIRGGCSEAMEIIKALKNMEMEEAGGGRFSSGFSDELVRGNEDEGMVVAVEWSSKVCRTEGPAWGEKEEAEMEKMFAAARKMVRN